MNLITLYIFIFGVSVGLFILLVAFIQIRKDKQKEATGRDAADTMTTPTTAPSASAAWMAMSAASEAPTEAAPAEMASSIPEPIHLSTSAPSTLPPSVSIPEPVGTPFPAPAAAFGPRSGPVEVARLIHTPDGALILEANGNRYMNRQDITDPKVLAVLAELERFLNSNAATTPGPQPAPVPDGKTPAKPTVMVDGKKTIVMTAAEAAQLPLSKPSMDIFRQMRTLRDRENQPQIKIKSVIEEIDEVLQARLRDSPLAGRGIKVSSDVNGGASFVVDDQMYSGVDQIPDAEARAMIQAAIKEWEQK